MLQDRGFQQKLRRQPKDLTGQRGGFSLPEDAYLELGGGYLVSPAASPLPTLPFPDCWSWKGPDQVLRASKGKEVRTEASLPLQLETRRQHLPCPTLLHRNPGGLSWFTFFSSFSPKFQQPTPIGDLAGGYVFTLAPTPTQLAASSLLPLPRHGRGALQLGDGADFPFGTAGVGGGPHWVKGEGRESSPDMGLRENLTFLECEGHYIKNQKANREPQEPCVNQLSSSLPTWAESAVNNCPQFLQANAFRDTTGWSKP